MDSRTRIAARVAEIEPFHVMEVQTAARALEAAGRSVIHMEIGEPDFPTPQPVLDAAQRAIAGGRFYYTSALGLPELREAIAAHYADHYGVRISADPARHVEWLRQDLALGFERLYLHNVNREQERFIEVFGEKVVPQLAR